MLIDKTYVLPFSVAQTYAAWVSPDTVIAPATRMEVSPVVGGLYQLFIEGGENNTNCEGLFDIVEPENRLRYTWQWDGDNEITVVDVSFKPAGERTEVRIRHSGFERKDSFEKHDKGWDSYIDGLTAHLKA